MTIFIRYEGTTLNKGLIHTEIDVRDPRLIWQKIERKGALIY